MNKVRALAAKFGSLGILADEIGVDRAVVSRWASTAGVRAGHGRVPSHYNHAIISAAARLGLPDVSSHLEMHVCPCCGGPLEPGQAVTRPAS